MKKYLVLSVLMGICSGAVAATPIHSTFSCGEGYILKGAEQNLYGIPTNECEKLWCYDLETGAPMGSGGSAKPGYQMTKTANEVCDADGKCVSCWGERVWCRGGPSGVWNPDLGIYVYSGDDGTTYESKMKGNCWLLQLKAPYCEEGKTAILKNGKWICAVGTVGAGPTRESSVRRTGAVHKVK